MLRRTTLAASLLVASVAAPSTGCFLFENPGRTPVIVGDDVRMAVPQSRFRAAGERGEAMELADEITTDVNRWVAEMAGGIGEIIEEVNEHEPTSRDGQWRVYGPADADDGSDASWMVRIKGNETYAEFELQVGERGARESDLIPLIWGEVSADDGVRDGEFHIDFETIKALPALADKTEPDEDFGGQIGVTFSRDTNTGEKDVQLDFDGFWYMNDEEDLAFEDEQYVYHVAEDGSGVFHFAAWAPLDDEGWSGPEDERVVVDMAWDDQEAARARLQVLEVEGQGDLRFGELTLHECAGRDQELDYRFVNEPYASEEPGYNFGDESECQLEESALDEYAD